MPGQRAVPRVHRAKRIARTAIDVVNALIEPVKALRRGAQQLGKAGFDDFFFSQPFPNAVVIGFSPLRQV
jgi:hypothetical protein